LLFMLFLLVQDAFRQKFIHWSLTPQVISLYSITFCQQFVHWSLILNIVSLAQNAFSYSLSIDLSLLMPLPFTSFHSSQLVYPQQTPWYEVIYLCILYYPLIIYHCLFQYSLNHNDVHSYYTFSIICLFSR